MIEENEIKKEYLRSYEKSVRQMERSELKIREMRLNKMCPSVINDGMPHGSAQGDLSGYAALMDKEERKYAESRCQVEKIYAEIGDKIEQLENENEKDILTYRYIHLMKWEDICGKTGYSWQHTHRIHARALKNFKM